MSKKTRAQHISDITNINSLHVADGKIDAAELKDVQFDVPDSAEWLDEPVAMAALNFDWSVSRWQTKTLSSNSALTCSNPVIGAYARLDKSGAYTLTLPTGNRSASGSVVPAGRYTITFSWDGTKYDFNFAEYTDI